MAKRTWTDEEIALLAQHKVPQGRSLNAARIKAWELHIPFRPNDPNAEPTVPPRNPIQVPTWTDDDLAMLQEKVPTLSIDYLLSLIIFFNASTATLIAFSVSCSSLLSRPAFSLS